jgi:hypothetical protein
MYDVPVLMANLDTGVSLLGADLSKQILTSSSMVELYLGLTAVNLGKPQ